MSKTLIGVVVIVAFAILAVGSITAFGFGNGNMVGLNEEDQAERESFRLEVQTAVENGEFEAWKSLMESQLTEERFLQMQEQQSQMSEMKNLHEQLRTALQDGDDDLANELKSQIQELMPEGFGQGMKMGFEKGAGEGSRQGFQHGKCPFAEAE